MTFFTGAVAVPPVELEAEEAEPEAPDAFTSGVPVISTLWPTCDFRFTFASGNSSYFVSVSFRPALGDALALADPEVPVALDACAVCVTFVSVNESGVVPPADIPLP